MTEFSNTQIVRAADYDYVKDKLTISFTSGYKTAYCTPPDVFEKLLDASSKDDFFKANIENNGYAVHNC
jgi:hypothetical protein